MNCLPLDAQKIIMNTYFVWVNAKTKKDQSFNDQPCVVFMSGLYAGNKYWSKNDLRHRDNDKPAEVFPDGTCRYFKDDEEYFPKSKSVE